MSVCLSLCLSVSLSLCLSVSLSLCLSVSLSLCLSVSLCLCFSVSLSLCLSVSLSPSTMCVCVCLSLSLSLPLSPGRDSLQWREPLLSGYDERGKACRASTPHLAVKTENHLQGSPSLNPDHPVVLNEDFQPDPLQ